jgi:anti-anti-sigma factor
MPYHIEKKENYVTVQISGEFDAILAKSAQKELEQFKKDDKLEEVIFDFAETTHIASSGLRIIIFAEERLATGCSVTIKNAQDIVLEVIKMSGIDAFVNLIED